MVGVCLFLGILAGSWGLTQWLCERHPEPHPDADSASRSTSKRRGRLSSGSNKTTWGVNLVEVNGQRYAILPESTPENPLLSMDGRPTVRLSSE